MCPNPQEKEHVCAVIECSTTKQEKVSVNQCHRDVKSFFLAGDGSFPF